MTNSDDRRPNPERLLKAIENEENKNGGRLEIFFGYAAGVGKTYAMLEAAHALQKNGVDVVVGYIEPHSRPKTAALLEGLEILPPLKVEKNGVTTNEFDLDAALARNPEVILVDELAHTNAEGCRHKKRFLDVKELQQAGIDVFTTLNVQHIESLNDIVAEITRVNVRERVPDSVFDGADQVELIDIEPARLIMRLEKGEVYKEEHAKRALENFFTEENLTALREIALRRCADRVNILTENARIKRGGEYHTDEHILVCLSPSPSNPKVIRTAARMAKAYKGIFTAVYVERSDFAETSEADKKALRDNTRLAEELGAKTETVYGENIASSIAEYAYISGVSKVVIGRSVVRGYSRLWRRTLIDALIANAPNLEIHIIPGGELSSQGYAHTDEKNKFVFSLPDFLKTIFILAAASGIGIFFEYLDFDDANIITVYLLGVLVTSVITGHRAYSLFAAFVSVPIFNFLFTRPIFTFEAYDQGYPVTFFIMLIAALITGTLAENIKKHTKQLARVVYRLRLLFDTNHLLLKARNRDEVTEAAAKQLRSLLGKSLIIYTAENGMLGEPRIFAAEGEALDKDYYNENERAVAAWVLKNMRSAGASTDTLSNARCLYYAMKTSTKAFGVLGIVMDDKPLDIHEIGITLSVLGECALALENIDVRGRKEKKERG